MTKRSISKQALENRHHPTSTFVTENKITATADLLSSHSELLSIYALSARLLYLTVVLPPLPH
jgi:hypothetical protein